MAVTFDEKMFRIIFFFCYLALAFGLACAIFSAATINTGQSNLYIKTDITGTGSGSSYHEGRLGESSGFKNASTDYHYLQTRDYDTGIYTQSSKFLMDGGEASYWNYHRVWTDKDLAGKDSIRIDVSNIAGSYYGASGMNISYNEADGSEELESTIKIDTTSGNASITMRVINWTTGKPVSLEEIDRVGQFVVDSIVKLSTPVTTEQGWLDFCGLLDSDVILDSGNSGIYVAPMNNTLYNYLWDKNLQKIIRTINQTS